MAFQRIYAFYTLILCWPVLYITSSALGAEVLASKNYVDRLISSVQTSAVLPGALTSYFQLSGGTMTGDISMGGNKITGLGAPTDSADAVTKEYVDSQIALLGLSLLTPLSPVAPKVVISAGNPDSCSSYTSAKDADTNSVSGCSGGDINGASVSEFVVGGYCGGSGSGSYSSPVVQTCSSCSRATAAADKYCYCKIHSINGLAVASSSRFVLYSGNSNASNCAYFCAFYCAYYARSNSGFRSALFSALGS